ncbi:hypothetical protein EIP91_000884 [Steccherinum ochraceum]|uniref:Uncharacterized protein n=1 Tax=Steccherinum ochraceum TaxID=92696 RepID=A0A4R0RSW1_9APHY|nr:hypothetical protein EIP91_000884 [Steccherinum ochraceum]
MVRKPKTRSAFGHLYVDRKAGLSSLAATKREKLVNLSTTHPIAVNNVAWLQDAKGSTQILNFHATPNNMKAVGWSQSGKRSVQNRSTKFPAQHDPVAITNAEGKEVFTCPACVNYLALNNGSLVVQTFTSKYNFRRRHCCSEEHVFVLEAFLGLQTPLDMFPYQCPDQGCNDACMRGDELRTHCGEAGHPLVAASALEAAISEPQLNMGTAGDIQPQTQNTETAFYKTRPMKKKGTKCGGAASSSGGSALPPSMDQYRVETDVYEPATPREFSPFDDNFSAFMGPWHAASRSLEYRNLAVTAETAMTEDFYARESSWIPPTRTDEEDQETEEEMAAKYLNLEPTS